MKPTCILPFSIVHMWIAPDLVKMCCKRDIILWKETNIMATKFLVTFCNSSYVDAPESVKNVLQKRRKSLKRDLYYCYHAWRNRIHTSVDRSKVKMVLQKRHISLKKDLYYGFHFLRNRVIHARITLNLRRCCNCDIHLWKDTHTHTHTHTSLKGDTCKRHTSLERDLFYSY